MIEKVKLYFDPQLVDFNQRESLFEVLKSKERFERKNSPLDRNLQERITWVEDPLEAEIWVLPMIWNYYYKFKDQNRALAYCAKAEKLSRIVISSSGGDQGITVPVSKNTIVFRQSGYRSKMKENERCMPFILSDPVGKFVNSEGELYSNNKREKPVVGFCGMAPHGAVVGIKERLQILKRNIKSIIGISPDDTQALLSSSNLRFNVLMSFERNNWFSTNYLIRQKYRGGIQTAENRRNTTLEYYNNQVQSNLVTCVRGVGNFSLRFYETLAMGRIPIFVDTDSPLPEIGGKDWNDYIIWVEQNKIDQAPQIAKAWLEGKNIIELEKKNRQLWIEHFRLDNFWINELELVASNSRIKR